MSRWSKIYILMGITIVTLAASLVVAKPKQPLVLGGDDQRIAHLSEEYHLTAPVEIRIVRVPSQLQRKYHRTPFNMEFLSRFETEPLSYYNHAGSQCGLWGQMGFDMELIRSCVIVAAIGEDNFMPLNAVGAPTFKEKWETIRSLFLNDAKVFEEFNLYHESSHAISEEWIRSLEQDIENHNRSVPMKKQYSLYQLYQGEMISDMLGWYEMNKAGFPLPLNNLMRYRMIDSQDCQKDWNNDSQHFSRWCDPHQTEQALMLLSQETDKALLKMSAMDFYQIFRWKTSSFRARMRSGIMAG